MGKHGKPDNPVHESRMNDVVTTVSLLHNRFGSFDERVSRMADSLSDD